MKSVRPSAGKKRVASSEVAADHVVAAIDAAATRHRLLDAAGVVFADVGYERAGVRDICGRAKANVAAVKYHFGGKYQLYEAALAHWFDRQERQHPLPAASAMNGEAALRLFIRTFVGRLLDREKPAWHARLMAREMVEPTGVLDRMVTQSILPTLEHLRRIVRQIVGTECPKVIVERAMLSVISQCVFYHHSRPILERVFPEHIHEPDIDAIVDHITAFSTAGLRAICKRHRVRGDKGGHS